jgi:hypothetical protein
VRNLLAGKIHSKNRIAPSKPEKALCTPVTSVVQPIIRVIPPLISIVAAMEQRGIRGFAIAGEFPDYAALDPGYCCTQ